MREAFNNGRDIHRYTASLMFGVEEDKITDEERRQAKAVNFGAAYGWAPAAWSTTSSRSVRPSPLRRARLPRCLAQGLPEHRQVAPRLPQLG